MSSMNIETEQWKGKKIYVLNYSKYDKDTTKCLILLRNFSEEVKGSNDFIRVFIDGRGMQYTSQFINESKKITRETFNALTGKTTIIGVTVLQQIILKGYNLIAKNKIIDFKTKEEAFEYLTSD